MKTNLVDMDVIPLRTQNGISKDAAIKAMREGKRVTHRYFGDDEWMTMEGCMIILEDGVRVEQTEFWSWRDSEQWDDGYKVLD